MLYLNFVMDYLVDLTVFINAFTPMRSKICNGMLQHIRASMISSDIFVLFSIGILNDEIEILIYLALSKINACWLPLNRFWTNKMQVGLSYILWL